MHIDQKILIEISNLINTKIFLKLNYNNYNIFLVGAGRNNQNSIRDIIRDELTQWQYVYRMDVYYPEALFEELTKVKSHFDLLSLENLLAKSVHAVVIILESPGSIAELGAFSNHELLQNKLIVVVDKKYKNKKSFINLGLLRFLRKTESKVIFCEFKNFKTDSSLHYLGNFRFIEKLRKSIREVSENSKIDYSVSNPILAQYFLLSTIYVTEPINKQKLNFMIESIISEGLVKKINKSIIETIFHSALNILLLRKEVILHNKKYCLTQNGVVRLHQSLMYIDKSSFNDHLDEIRIKYLNYSLRKNYYRNQRRELNELS